MNQLTWSLIAAVNDDSVLSDNLLSSPDVTSAREVILKRGFASAGQAYDSAMSETRGDLLVFAHQDVYFPAGWISGLKNWVSKLSTTAPNWGVLGVMGVTASGEAHGHIYSTGLGKTVGHSFEAPATVQSVDEMVIIIKRDSAVRFDPKMFGYHLYGTDICLQSLASGFACYAIDNFCIHNSNGMRRLPISFWRSYAYLRSKWFDRLPVRSPCVTIKTSLLWPFLSIVRDLRNRATPGRRVRNPAHLFNELTKDMAPVLSHQ